MMIQENKDIQLNVRDVIKFDTAKYFENYVEIAEGIMSDIAHFYGDFFAATTKEDVEAFQKLCQLPIHRGYIERDEYNIYSDVYLDETDGKIYSQEELIQKYNDKNVSTALGFIDWQISQDPYGNPIQEESMEFEPVEMGLYDLFYYKNNPDGLQSPYVVLREEEEIDLER